MEARGGSDAEPELVSITKQRDHLLETIAVDGTVEMAISAMNRAGESAQSEWGIRGRKNDNVALVPSAEPGVLNDSSVLKPYNSSPEPSP